jgi:hypothetical protein
MPRVRLHQRPKVLGFLVVATLAALTTGCGSGGDPPAPTAASPTPPPTNGAPTTVTREATRDSTTLGSTRQPVATTQTLPPADIPVDNRIYVPESDIEFHFAMSRMNGVSYENALIMTVPCSNNSKIEIDLGRGRRGFVGDLGVPDDQLSDTEYKVDTSFDLGAPVLSSAMRFGETTKLNLDATGFLRLKLSISPLNGCERRSTRTLAIGNPRFR